MSTVSEETTVGDHFEGKAPAVRETYDHLLAILREIGPAREEPKKTSIHLVRASALAAVEVRREYLLLNLKADHRIESPRIAKAEQLSARRFHHKIKLSSPEDIDTEIRRWLRDAYELSGR